MANKSEIAEKTLDRLLEWVTRFDNKSAIVFAIDIGMVAVLASFAANEKSWGALQIAFLILSLGTTTASLVFVVLSAYPRTKGPVSSVIYFGSIAQISETEFRDEFTRLTDEQYLDDLLAQCHRNAVILNEKFKMFRLAFVFLFSSIPIWAVAVYLFSRTTSG
jgi:hypothetical protein